MEEIRSEKILDFFAAANSYGGFISYFDKVFIPEEYKKIYLLKGGPGTGKSSFMKSVGKAFSDEKYRIEYIYCSSDPRSLDGVIIYGEGKKIAIIDATAPHEKDAKYPGAVEEIINLADHLDKSWLKANREAIISKSANKSNAYKNAYNFLKIAGASSELIKATYQEAFSKTKAKSEAESILQDIPSSEGGKMATRLVSSFGRDGEYRLNTLSRLQGRRISILGNEYASSLFLGYCLNILSARGVNIINLPCALDPAATDAIHLPDFKLTLMREKDSVLNIDDLFKLSSIDLDKVKKADELRTKALDEAKRWFSIASEIHFSLEDIYGRAMDFYKNESLVKEKIAEIGIILENTR